ncbi:MAG: hypothetical protein IKL25_09780 [Clostridia bacterium]|nr:hypothetical protein [Clostridia bacterium]
MHAKFRAAVSHGLLAYLMSLGLVLTLLGATGLLRHGWLAAGTLLVLTSGITVVTLNRKVLLGAGCAVLFVALVWLMIGGAGVMGEVFQALILHMSGLTTALPMVGAPFAVLACVVCAAVSWFITHRSAGAYPALILLMLIAVLLWLGNMADSLICLAPAAFACVTLLLRAGDERTSTLHVLPLAAAVTAIAFAGVLAGGAVFQPLKQAADDLRQRIYDTFFYTQPRDVFTLASEGYYPQGISQLGGPAKPHETPVMRVVTPRRTYLRGVIKNVYTGRVWLDDIGGRRYLMSAPRFEKLRTAAFDQDLPLLDGAQDAALLAPQQVRVQMLQDSASTIFVPQRLRQLTPEGELVPYFNGSSEVFATSNLVSGNAWTAEAPLFTAHDPGLAALVTRAGAAPDPRWQQMCDTYLQLPEHLQPEIFEMAQEAIQGADSPYEQAVALQRFLASGYTYNLDVPEQNPEQDFVSTFLLINREGYCTHFASAMTVLCRMVGLPARYVEGYVAYPDSTGVAVVTGKEGHAWTEVYFRGFGWVTFDATPINVTYAPPPPDGGSADDSSEPEQTPEPEAAPTATPEPSEEPEASPEQTPQPSEEPREQPGKSEQETPTSTAGTPWLWLLALLAALLLVLRVVLVQPDVQARISQTAFGRWMAYTQAAHDALHQMGFSREKSETPATLFVRADASGRLPLSLQKMAEAQSLMFYGHAEPYAEEIAQARDVFRGLYSAMIPRQKMLFQLRRIILPAALRGEITK